MHRRTYGAGSAPIGDDGAWAARRGGNPCASCRGTGARVHAHARPEFGSEPRDTENKWNHDPDVGV